MELKRENYRPRLPSIGNLWQAANRLLDKGLTNIFITSTTSGINIPKRYNIRLLIGKTLPIFVNFFTKLMIHRGFQQTAVNRQRGHILNPSAARVLFGYNVLWSPNWPSLQPIYARTNSSDGAIRAIRGS